MTRALPTLLLLAAAHAQDGGACRPADAGPTTSTTSGSFTSDGVAMDWQAYDPWSGGHCLSLRFTNTGAPTRSWSFAVELDAAVSDLSWPGEPASRVSAAGRTLTFAPVADAALRTFGIVEHRLCLEPAAVPISFVATVEREEEPGPEDGPLFGNLVDPSGRLLVTWDQRTASLGPSCFDVIIGNLTDRQILSWQVGLQFGSAIELTASDGRFFVLDERLGELDVRPTSSTDEIEPRGTVVGEICIAPLLEPYAITAELELADETSLRPPVVGGRAPGAPPLPASQTPDRER